MINPYEILGVSKNCNSKDIKKAYRNLCMIHHPDKGGDAEHFRVVQISYEVLINRESRKLYDQQGVILDDNDSIELENRATQLFKELVSGWIQQNINNETSITDYFIRHIEMESVRLNDNSKDLTKVLLSLKKMTERVESKDEENLVVQMINQKIAETDLTINRIAKEILVLSKIKDICNCYSSKELKNNINQHNMFESVFSYTTNTGRW